LEQMDETHQELHSQIHMQRELFLESERTNDDLRDQMDKLQQEIKILKSSHDDAVKNSQVNNGHELSSASSTQTEDFSSVLEEKENEIIRWQRLYNESQEALQMSEDNMKAVEEVAWKAKAEAAEYLSALEFEQRKNTQQDNIDLRINISTNMQILAELTGVKISWLCEKEADFLSQCQEVINATSSKLQTLDSEYKQAIMNYQQSTNAMQEVRSKLTQLQEQLSLSEKQREAMSQKYEAQMKVERQQLAEITEQFNVLRPNLQK
jgi:hypothetical protein